MTARSRRANARITPKGTRPATHRPATRTAHDRPPLPARPSGRGTPVRPMPIAPVRRTGVRGGR